MTLRTVSFAVLRGLVGGVALTALMQGLVGLFAWATPTPDANIGAGLIAFMAGAGFAFLWLLLEGRIAGLGAALLVAAVAGLTSALAGILWIASQDATSTSTVLEQVRYDLSLIPFLAGLVAGPGAVGAVIGYATRRPGQG